MSVTKPRKRAISKGFAIPGLTLLEYTFWIRYPVQFQENLEILAPIDFGSEINTMTPTYAVNLGLFIWESNFEDLKIDVLTFVTYSMILAWLLIQEKLDRVLFFEETFLETDISMKVILGIPFLALSNVNIRFAKTVDLT